MSGLPPEGELVESGSFRIDRRRTLDKLQRYQIPGGPRGFFAWIRAAVAGGATEISVRASTRELRVSFDGTPFEKAGLQDPYAALFSREGPHGERNRHFALGLLWAWRSGAAEVSVVSGGHRLLCSGIAEDELRAAPPSKKTEIVVARKRTWTGFGRGASLDAELLGRECALVPAALSLDGEPIPTEPIPDWSAYRFRAGPVRGAISPPATAGDGRSRVGLYAYGVRVCDHEVSDAGFPFGGAVNDDRFSFNASFTKVVDNAVLRSALAELQKRYGPFLAHCAQELTRRGPETGSLLVSSARLREEWRRLFDFDSTNDGEPEPSWIPWGAPFSKRMRVHVNARVSAWLRLVSETVSRGYSREPAETFEKALWKAPLIFDVRGRPVSLERLQREDRGPRIRFSRKRRSAHTKPDWIVWALTTRDAPWLRRVATRTPVDVTMLPERAW